MSAPNLGEAPNSDLRDAVHIPVAPVMAGFDLQPGAWVKMMKGLAVPCAIDDAVGIADPLRKEMLIPAGSKFWLFMRKIDGQPRHSWQSPDFPDELAEARSAGFDEGVEEGQCCYGGG